MEIARQEEGPDCLSSPGDATRLKRPTINAAERPLEISQIPLKIGIFGWTFSNWYLLKIIMTSFQILVIWLVMLILLLRED